LAEKKRVYILARELGIDSGDVIDACHRLGLEVKNQLTGLTQEQCDAVVQQVRRGGGGVAVAAPPKPSPLPSVRHGQPPTLPPARTVVAPPKPAVLPRPVPPTVPSKVEAAAVTPPAPPAPPLPVEPAAVALPPPAVPPAPVAEAPSTPPAAPEPPAPVERPAAAAAEPAPAPPAPPARSVEPAAPAVPALTPPASAPEREVEPPAPLAPAASKPAEAAPPEKPPEAGPPAPPSAPAAPPTPPRAPELPRVIDSGRVRTLGGGARPDSGRTKPRPTPRVVSGPILATPPTPSVRTPKPPEKKEATPSAGGVKKIMDLSDEQKRGEKTVTIQELLKPGGAKGAAPPLVGPVIPTTEEPEEDADGKKRPGGVHGREGRHEKRAKRALERGTKGREEEGGVLVVDGEERVRTRSRGGRRPVERKRTPGTQARKGKVPIEVPITVRALSEAFGVPAMQILFKMKELGLMATINSTVEADLAETLALDFGCELDIKRPPDAEQILQKQGEQPDNPEDLVPRAPIVTIMGHVDHGKTSLLDYIRRSYGFKSDVVSTEAGRITQVIRAWRVEKDGKAITFLDTPGHEAFTKMRARGANVTDIAVIVVGADDGVMPQTEEAITHARAAGVAMVVAINKVDLPSANVEKTRRQLYSLNVLPDNMGGDVPFVETSAVTGLGVDDLLENLLLVAELKELKANPNKPGRGTCLEASLSPGEGVQATLLVQDGTLRRGDVILCGATSGKVRAMFNDVGTRIEEAGPTVPVRVIGLDDVPSADDPFQVVADLVVAKEVADQRKARHQREALQTRQPLKLEDLKETKVAELKVILKADRMGSIEAIRKELEKLHHEEVRVRILEAAIGGINVNDVWLALTSPQDTVIVGFNAVPDDQALILAEQHGVQIRQYDIIYNLANDIREALEGKLKPREEVVHLGRAVVRETFKISRVGTIAGCYVTHGTIERSAKVRVIREGVVVYPPADRTVGLESLKRFKEDAREVREGFECGMKIAGYDDIKVGDVIEAYRVEQVQRKLDK
jgi:translation initiation factor IF-2